MVIKSGRSGTTQLHGAVFHNGTAVYLKRFTSLEKLLSSALALKLIEVDGNGAYQVTPANGDKLFMYPILDGTETKLSINLRSNPNGGKFDIYLNGVLDSSGYDNYSAGSTNQFFQVTLSSTPVKGANTIEFRVNGKNVASTDYQIQIRALIVQ